MAEKNEVPRINYSDKANVVIRVLGLPKVEKWSQSQIAAVTHALLKHSPVHEITMSRVEMRILAWVPIDENIATIRALHTKLVNVAVEAFETESVF